MNQDEIELKERARKAAKIIADPASYKVCEECDSIVTRPAVFCPNCNGYRFNEEPAEVAAQARKLAGQEQTSVTQEDLL